MKNRKLNQLLVAGMISAAMMTSGISVQAADFSDDTSTVEEQSVGSAEEEAPEVEDGSEFQSDAAEASSAVAVSSANFPDAKFRQYVLDNIDTDKDTGHPILTFAVATFPSVPIFNSSIFIPASVSIFTVVLSVRPLSYTYFPTQRMPLPHIFPCEPSALYISIKKSALSDDFIRISPSEPIPVCLSLDRKSVV